jgi:GT2 family glycosyltransferase
MATKTRQELAIQAMEEGRPRDAQRLLASALEEGESSDLWNDWATVKASGGAPGDVDEACAGYERALALEPGFALAAYNLGVLHVLRGRAAIGLPLLREAAPRLGPEDRAHAEALVAEHGRPESPRGKRVLLVHDALPQFDRSGADLRILQVVRRLRARGHEVAYLARSGEHEERYRSALDELGVAVYAGDAERLAALCVEAPRAWRLEQVLAGAPFDVAILFHWFWSGISCTEHYLDDVRRLSPGTRVVVLTDDRHGVRELRGAELTGLSVDRERGIDFLARERECYRAADLVAAITEDDLRGLREMDPELAVELLPMTAEVHEAGAPFDARRGFAFFANFDDLANRDAVAWLLDEIWPRVRARLPDAALDLVANNVPPHLGSRPGVRVVGHVPRVADAFARYRVFLSPFRVGTGIKTRNLAALGHGVPMVTTAVGAEGMGLRDGEHALLADAAPEFAAKAVELYERRDRWEAIASAGRRHVGEAFSVARLDERLERVLERACAAAARPHDPAHRFSVREVEASEPRALTAPVGERVAMRLGGYLALGERLLAEGRPAEALAQLRHAFTHVRGGPPRSLLFWRIFRAMERCYREAGDGAAAARCARDAQECLPQPDRKLRQGPARRREDRAISVVLPTFNRRATLARCLAALGAQTLPAGELEVVVVDDGSTDGTAEFLAGARTPFRLVVHRQENRGAGAARAAGVERASGTYLLLANDDSIAEPGLLEEHLGIQREHHDACFAVLGAFEYEAAAHRRALTHFLNGTPFLFPQRAMQPDQYYGPSQFVTCNLSVRRDAVVAAGNFDPSFRLGEDTELGIRLAGLGCAVLHAPGARAWHDHLDVSVADLVRRARAYGAVWLQLLEKHRRLVLAQLDVRLAAPVQRSDVERVRAALAPQRDEIERILRLLEQQDAADFEALLASGGGAAAEERMVEAFSRAILRLHWHHVLDGLCAAWEERRGAAEAPHAARASA